jgi:HEAT repeat protein
MVLGNSRDARAFQALIVTLRDGYSPVRSTAATALGETRNPKAVEPLIVRLGDEDAEVRLAAAQALQLLQWKPTTVSGRVSQAISLQQWDDAISLGADAVEPLIVALSQNDRDVQAAAARSLGKIGDARAVKPLITLYLCGLMGQKEVRRSVAAALERMGTSVIQPLLVEIGKENRGLGTKECDGLREILIKCVGAIGDTGDAHSLSPLVAAFLFKNGGQVVKSTAADALRKTLLHLEEFGDADAVDTFFAELEAKALGGRDWEERADAIQVLAWVGGARAVEVIIRVMHSKQNLKNLIGLAVQLGNIGDPRGVSAIVDFIQSMGRMSPGDAKTVVSAIERILNKSLALVDTDTLTRVAGLDGIQVEFVQGARWVATGSYDQHRIAHEKWDCSQLRNMVLPELAHRRDQPGKCDPR